MARLMHGAQDLASNHANIWQIAKGPAMVVLASLARIGWSWNHEEPFHWKMANGQVISLLETSAADIEVLARKDVRKWLWAKASTNRAAYSDFHLPPYTAPLCTLIRAKDRPGWGPEHKGMLRSIASDAWWGSGTCDLCGMEWSTWHAHWQCPAMARFKLQYNLPDSIIRCADRGQQVALFSVGMLVDPVQSFPWPLMELQMVWDCSDDMVGHLGSEAFGDGSGINVHHDGTRRCGLGIVAASRTAMSNYLGTTVHAALPGVIQEVPVAELMALMVFLRHSVADSDGKLTFYTDCEWVIESFEAGEAYVTHPMRRFAGSWKAFFVILDDVLPDRRSLTILKVKGHQTILACNGDEELLYRKRGNDEADLQAKKGAALHPLCPEDLARLRRCNIVVPAVAKFMARQAVWRRQQYGNAVLPQRPPLRRLRCKTSPEAHALVASVPAALDTGRHRPCTDPFTLRTRCCICLASALDRATLERQPCRDGNQGLLHRLWRVRDFVFCKTCGAHSSRRTIGLGQACNGEPKSRSAEERRVRLLNGIHPLKGHQLGGAPHPVILWDDWHDTVASSLDDNPIGLVEFPELMPMLDF